jgi:hypothetical protein
VARLRRLRFVNNLVLLDPANSESANLRAGIGLEAPKNATSSTNWAGKISEQISGNQNAWFIRGNILGLGAGPNRPQYGVDIATNGALETSTFASFSNTYIASGDTTNTQLNVSVDSNLVPSAPPAGTSYERYNRLYEAWFDYYDNVRPENASYRVTAGAVKRTL